MLGVAADNPLNVHGTAVHFIFKCNDWWSIEMPCQAGIHCAAAHQFFSDERVNVMHCIKLSSRGVTPQESERGHAIFHFTQYPSRFFFQPRPRQITCADDVVLVIALSLRRLSAAGHDKRWECR